MCQCHVFSLRPFVNVTVRIAPAPTSASGHQKHKADRRGKGHLWQVRSTVSSRWWIVGVPAAWPQPRTPLLRQIIDLGAVAFSLREMQSHWLSRSFENENENNKLRIQSIQKKLSKRIPAYKWTYQCS